jgi:hypothetical protein
MVYRQAQGAKKKISLGRGGREADKEHMVLPNRKCLADEIRRNGTSVSK